MLIDLLLRWWLRSGRYPISRLYRRLVEGKYLKYNLPAVSSLEDIKEALDEITWTPDTALRLFDTISYPQATWARKKDDCDGFSCLAAQLFQAWEPQYQPVLLTTVVRPVKNSHTVCVFKQGQDKLRFFDNNIMRNEISNSYGEIAALIRKDNIVVCWDVADPFSLKTKEFHRG
jgi:hypothetical protein